MKKDSELIQVMIDNFHLFKKCDYIGLCGFTSRLHGQYRKITLDELARLHDIIFEYMVAHNLSYKGSDYMYKPGLRWRRRIALKRMLKEAIKREQL